MSLSGRTREASAHHGEVTEYGRVRAVVNTFNIHMRGDVPPKVQNARRRTTSMVSMASPQASPAAFPTRPVL